MPTSPPPKELTPRHEVAAMLLATGMYKDVEIARRVGFEDSRYLSTLKRSPEFVALVDKFKTQLHERGIDEALRMLMDDVKPNLQFIQAVRDGTIDDHPSVTANRLRASQILFDRQMPKRTQVETTTSGHVVLEHAIVRRLADTAAEIDVTPVPAVDAPDESE